MKKSFFFTALMVLASIASFAQVKWNADPAHTSILFSVKHLGLSFVQGHFNKFSGTIETADSTSFQNAKVDFTVDVASISTGVDQRDGHLKTDDFFNAAEYPTITLKSVSMKKVAGNKYVLLADLTIRNTTKRVAFDVTYNGVITDPWGLRRAGFTAKATINRLDYGIKYADKLPSGVDAVAPNVDITVNVEAVKK
ncbi:Polyisoprenoid-binding protein YceI [Chitinophaga terrae (ex Kim and Jung 2007)]|uniref:Polyisoprenoid-binding protein YceI n=1 Tax=Chitinophaga terrae (ex Kim and Jung 2007) TaxID=408074 RepID=A0A1H4FDW4_9BACT|nr:YceI family protein [Chitinophaga terrae (ex Kim and Jung 2007)]MDQ0110173.1 polyisoprenoid-binding protein YceI [Chitinophaga terrae (ex Kim and Jung 2007)]GEP92410.1 polyisoprenoid-binding protein [Chitinophaga terrae (ex Kim and Jung 2007)]SEA95465.1 Polyisoprenoid-binding protein YceI [Chitinophaga terrae (ex Kim and Jung 2007)]